MAEKKENQYVSDNARLMAEWDWKKNTQLGYDPHKISYGSARKVWWLCAKGHQWESSPNQRSKRGCPYCSNQKILPGYNDLATLRPDLLEEWDYENNTIAPTQISAGTHKKAHWKCRTCGHKWSAEITARARANQGCPVCKKEKISKAVHQHYLHTNGSLMETHPELAAQWHPTKNKESVADMVAGSDQSVWWLGACGHEWPAVINSRVRGNNCPYCANQKVLPGFNDLESQFPELLQEWDYDKNTLVPSQTIATTDKPAWWICRVCGHNWPTEISQRTRLGRGCPQCGIQKAWDTKRQHLVDKKSSLIDTHPQLAAEWHPTKNTLSASQVSYGSNLKVWWLCPLGHEYQAVISSRSIIGSGCSVCANKQVLKGYNDLASQFPDIAYEWHPKNKLTSDEVLATSVKKFWWLCRTCGHEYYKSVESRTKYHQHCTKCNTRTSIAETCICYYLSQVTEQYIQSFRPDWMNRKEIDVFLPQYNLAIEYDGLLYHQNIERDISKSNIIKQNGITLLRIREQGCPELPTSDIVFVHHNPDEYSMLTQTLITVFTWLNQTYHISQPDINIERDMQKIMAMRAKQQKERSIATLRPDLLEEWDYERNIVSPELVAVSSEVRIHWKCRTCGHCWPAIAASRAKPNGSGCPVCAGRQVLPGYNDLATLKPDIALEWHPTKNENLTHNMVPCGSHKNIWWLCKCGREWQAKVYTRGNTSGCPECAKLKRKKKDT